MKIHFRISLSSKNCFVWWKKKENFKDLKMKLISDNDIRGGTGEHFRGSLLSVGYLCGWIKVSFLSFFCSCAFKLKSVIYIKCFKMKACDRGLSISSSLSLFIFFYFSLFFQFTNFVAANSSLVRCSSHYAPGY